MFLLVPKNPQVSMQPDLREVQEQPPLVQLI